MKRLIISAVMLLLPLSTNAGGGGGHLDTVYINLSDKASLQRGARTFVNYCLSCHNAAFMRYGRMAEDLGISQELLKNEMMFAADKPGDLMITAMPTEGSKAWFGVVPPDLSLTARSRGADWIYTYLRHFYLDGSTATGWNNSLFPNVAMPHVLYRWQGYRSATFKGDGVADISSVQYQNLAPGTLSSADYDSAIRDLTNFMVYLAEPAKLVRYRIGIWVMMFMVVFIMLTYLLKKEYWRDVH
ncbi:MAG: cytochrome c1 [Arenicellales bacterium]|jgi:ubiquinol-cytochrome c reductase cytochrome c1 subunit|nr:cytochrome c1 [Arenicellales bacterium]|tara:strand:+ start:132 stop:860 length:729 start_codon:yes stop_codon:yes gene_type:complete